MTATESKERKPIFVSLRAKLIGVLALLFVLAFAAIFFWLDDFVTNLMMSSLRTDLIATASTAANSIDGDMHENLITNGVIDDDAYTQIADLLRLIKRANPKASGVYTYVKFPADDEYTIRLVVSAALPPGAESADIAVDTVDQSLSSCKIPPSSRPDMLVTYSDTSPEMLAGVYESGSDKDLWSDDWGTWLSGYAPIHNAAGEPVGAVGVDMCAAEVIRLQENIRRNTLFAMSGAVVLLIILVGLIATGVTRPVSELTDMADLIGVGDYEVDLSRLYTTRIQDEVDKLASVFELMIGKVAEREKSLRKRVKQLEIMIDDSKRSEQVNEIVDSDFFRDLQEKAQSARERNKKGKKTD